MPSLENLRRLSAAFCASATIVLNGASALAAGPDVIVGFVDNAREDSRSSGGLVGLTASTNSCNAGDLALSWEELPDPKHPVISLNLYRLVDGRMQQLAKSWVKHGFFATNRNQCAGIPGLLKSCAPGPGGHQLRPGCSDLYNEDLNADPSNLGPRSKVNPTTGVFDGATAKDLGGYPNSEPTERIMAVDAADLGLANARYFLEAQYITADDAAAGNARNNTTFREVKPALVNGAWVLRNVTPETRMQPAISAWVEDGAELAEIQTDEGSGATSYMIVAERTITLGGGRYRYEYAVYNMNSDLAVRAFSVPIGSNSVSNFGFKGMPPRGEIWSSADWSTKIENGKITWSTSTSAENANANALRWGSAYNFWFEASAAPSRTAVSLSRFKPAPAGVLDPVTTVVPGPTP